MSENPEPRAGQAAEQQAAEQQAAEQQAAELQAAEQQAAEQQAAEQQAAEQQAAEQQGAATVPSPGDGVPAGEGESSGAVGVDESPAAGSSSAASPAAKAPVQIGSRRGGLQDPRTSAPQTAAPKAPPLIKPVTGSPTPAARPTPKAAPPKVPTPSRRDQLSAELEEEIDAALGGMSLEQLVASPGEASQESLELESRRRAAVVKVHGDNVFFSLGGRYEGFASLRQFKEPPEVGSQQDVIVSGYNADDGLYELLVPGASISVSDWSDVSEGAVVEARVTGSNTGGLECQVANLRGFIPASQISMYRVENLPDFVDQKLLCVVTEVNPARRNLVLSHRAVLEREKEEASRQLMEELEVGQKREGVVRSIREFGAFVDLGGVDGLIHISQLSWDRVGHPSEVLEVGQKVEVKVERIDRETGKLSLSYRDLLENPWDDIESKFAVGSVVNGVVTRIAKFGAFVKLTAGVEGLIHISELSHQRIKNVGAFVQEGQELAVQILTVDHEAQRIALSLRATQQSPSEAAAAAAEEEPLRDPAVKPRQGPLKGGVDRPSGGESLGLNW